MTLRVAGINIWPWLKLLTKEVKGRNVTTFDEGSFLGNILITLSKKLNFNYTFSFATYWGMKDLTAKSLKFNGMVGMLQEDQIDLALGPFLIDRGDRDLVADPSVIVIEDAFSILSSEQSVVFKSTIGVSLLTASFESNVWYLILFTLFSIILIFTIADYIWMNKYNKTTHSNSKSFNEILILNIFKYSGNLLKQNDYSNSHQLSGILKTCWKLTSFLLILFYSSMVLANLVASNKAYIETIEDLANSEVMTTTEKNTVFEVTIREGKTEALKRIYSQIENKGIHDCLLPHEKAFSNGILSDILSGKRALIYTLSELKSHLSTQVKQKQSCGFYLAESVIDHVPHFVLYNKKLNKKLKDKIDLMLLELFERKPFDWKLERYYSGYHDCLMDKTNSQWKPLILFNVRGLLLVCVIIITLAFIALFLELLKNNKLLLKKTRNTRNV